MDESLQKWVEHVQSVKPKMDALASRLTEHGATVGSCDRRVSNNIAYRARFRFKGAVVSVRFLLQDEETDSDVVITNITTLPKSQCRRGYGSKAMQQVLEWASKNRLNEVRATQVGGAASETFWRSNGFEQCSPPNNCGDFIHSLGGKS